MVNAKLEAPELMTRAQVAEVLQCSLKQVGLLCRKSRIPKPIYIGESSPRWKRSELLAAIDELAAAR